MGRKHRFAATPRFVADSGAPGRWVVGLERLPRRRVEADDRFRYRPGVVRVQNIAREHVLHQCYRRNQHDGWIAMGPEPLMQFVWGCQEFSGNVSGLWR